MSVLDNVIASAFLRAKDKNEAVEIARESLQFTGLYEDRDVISRGLPLGQDESGSRSRGRSPRSLSCCSSTSPLPA